MSFDIVTEPIDRWPGVETPRSQRKAPTFSAGYDATLILLRRELEHVDARGNVVIQVVTRNGASDLRRDGLLRAQARIDHPGTRVSFESKHGPLTYATDVFDDMSRRPGWQSNLRAIALGLEALRKVDRYGIAKSGEQYRGWRAIEATAGPGPVDVLKRWALGSAAYQDDLPIQGLARLARIAAHPDRHNGDHGPHNEVAAAAKQLGVEL